MFILLATGTDSLTDFKLGENRPSVENNIVHMFDVIRRIDRK